MAKRKLGLLRPFKSYRFYSKDPILAKVNTIIRDSGLPWSEISRRSGVSTATLHNCKQHGRVRRPQFCTVEATLRTCDKTLVVTNTRKGIL